MIRTSLTYEEARGRGDLGTTYASYFDEQTPNFFCPRCGSKSVIGIAPTDSFDGETGKPVYRSYVLCPQWSSFIGRRHAKARAAFDQDACVKMLYEATLEKAIDT